MQTQTFQAREIKEALALVRRELGPDAIVVGTRRVPGRALGLLGGTLIEVTARPAEAEPSERPAGVKRPPPEPEPEPTPVANRHKALLALNRAKRQQAASARPSTPQRSISSQPEQALAAATASMGKLTTHAVLRRRLLAGLVPRELCERWLARLPRDASRREAESQLRGALAQMLGGPAPLVSGDARVACFVGPTGVGKTTTIAKLAAHACLVDQRSVALVSLDDHRIGATAQLRAYADVLGVPLHTCGQDGSLNRTLASLRDIDLVLVDTAGVSPNGTDSLEPLRRRIARAGESVTVHLCVAAATRQEELDRILHVYGRLDPSALVATKLDEAVAIGSMYAGRSQADVPFSYVTTGQQVPDDIAPATPDMLIDVLLGGDQP